MAKSKPKRGRAPKLTPDVQKLIVDALAACTPRKYAANRAGVGESTLRAWIVRGKREKKGKYQAFLAAIKKAEAEAIIIRIARISKAAQGGQVVERTTKTVTVETKDGKRTTTTTTTEKHAAPQWVADAWMLERRCPEEFHYQRHEDYLKIMREIKDANKMIEAEKKEREKQSERQKMWQQNHQSQSRPLAPGERDPSDI